MKKAILVTTMTLMMVLSVSMATPSTAYSQQVFINSKPSDHCHEKTGGGLGKAFMIWFIDFINGGN